MKPKSSPPPKKQRQRDYRKEDYDGSEAEEAEQCV